MKKTSRRSPFPLCSTTGFLVAWGPSSEVVSITICCTSFTNCCTPSRQANGVADRSQTVCRRLHLARNANLCPDMAAPFPFYMREQFDSIRLGRRYRRKTGKALILSLAPSWRQPTTRLKAETMNFGEKMLTAEETADRLGVSRAWVLAHANGNRRPKLPSAKLGKLVRFRPEDLEKFIEECGR